MLSGLATVSFIIPAHNAAATLKEAVTSAMQQSYHGPIEVCVFDDISTDATLRVAEELVVATRESAWPGPRTLKVIRGADFGCDRPQGPAFGRNRAVESSSGAFLCMLDADDVALPRRVEAQLAVALSEPDDAVLIGGGFMRDPPESTASYTAWANSISDAELVLQQWRECTVIQPTWFCARSWWNRVGGWDEDPAGSTNRTAAATELAASGAAASSPPGASAGPARALDLTSPQPLHPVLPLLPSTAAGVPPPPTAAVGGAGAGGFFDRPPSRIPPDRLHGQPSRAPVFPEDTLFFHRHLHSGGRLRRVPAPVVVYRYSAASQSWATPRSLLLATRARLFEERVLTQPRWASFTIWGAGRDGKAFYNALSPTTQARVVAFADIDPNKVGKQYPQVQRQQRGRAPPRPVGDAVDRGFDGGRGGSKRPRDDGEDGGGGAAAGRLEVALITADGRAPRSGAPILHFTQARPPIVCCVAMQIASSDELRANVARLGLTPGADFWFFC